MQLGAAGAQPWVVFSIETLSGSDVMVAALDSILVVWVMS